MLIKFAIRNIFRNKKRSIISAISVFAGAIFVGLAYGWVNGMVDMMMNNFIRYQTGHVRITTEEFTKREKFLPVDELIPSADTLIKKIENVEGVVQVEKRVRFGILLTKDNTPMQIIGVGLDINNNSFRLREKVVEGELNDNGVFLGRRLAKKLEKKLGDEILIATQTSMGGLNGIKVPITAIVETKIAGFDEMFLFLPMSQAKRLLKLADGVTEIFVYGQSNDVSQDLRAKIDLILEEGQTVQTYQEQLGGFYSAMESVKVVYLMIELAILFLASIVIVNTMMMAIFERMREIGTMKALGFSEKQLFGMFTAEGAIIGIVGGIPGTIMGWMFVYYLSIHGVDFGSTLEGLSYPIEYVIRPYVKWTDLLAVMSIAFIVPTVAAMIPGRYIKRYMPADALRM